MYYIIPKQTIGVKCINEINQLLQICCEKYLHDKNLYLKLVSSSENGLLYELDYVNFKLKHECIGDIMGCFFEIALNNYKIYIVEYKETLQFFEENVQKKHFWIQDELLLKGMEEKEIKLKIEEYIKGIDTVNNDVIIIDSYLLPKNSTIEYKNLLKWALNQMNFSKLIIITNKRNFDESMFNEIKSGLDGAVLIYYSNTYHDRFWISYYKKGFTMGTSLNGIGKKTCRIDFLKGDEVEQLVSDVKKNI